MSEKVEMVPLPDWPDGHFDVYGEYEGRASLGTEHLPDDVVATPFALAVWAGTAADSPRMGSVQATFMFGERANPMDLTADEAEYVKKVLEAVLRKVRAT